MTPVQGAARLALAGAMLLAAVPAQAQLIRTRPFQGIFRTTQDPADSRDRIDVRAFVAAGHDESSLEVGGVDVPLDDRLRTATFGSLLVTGAYVHTGRRTSFSANGGTATRYYQGLPGGLTPLNATGGVQFSGSAGRRGSFALNGSAAYSPYYTFSLAPRLQLEEPAEAAPVFDPDTDLRAARRATYSYDAGASYSHRFARRSQLQLAYGSQYVNSVEGAYDLLSQHASVRLAQDLGRQMGLYVGYGARLSDYVASPFQEVVAHDLDAGFSYARTLPFARRTRIALAAGSGFIVQHEARRFFVSGNASLHHQFTRTWSAALAYSRGNAVLHGFAAPFFTFSDSVGLSVLGRLVGPVTLSTFGSYSHGTFSVQSVKNVVDSGSGSVRINVPVIWFLSAYVEGYYAEYRFARRVGLLDDMPQATSRFGTRAGLTFLLPVLR